MPLFMWYEDSFFFSGSQIESLKHSHKVEVANIKLECTRSKGELERERDTLQGQVDGMDTTHIRMS